MACGKAKVIKDCFLLVALTNAFAKSFSLCSCFRDASRGVLFLCEWRTRRFHSRAMAYHSTLLPLVNAGSRSINIACSVRVSTGLNISGMPKALLVPETRRANAGRACLHFFLGFTFRPRRAPKTPFQPGEHPKKQAYHPNDYSTSTDSAKFAGQISVSLGKYVSEIQSSKETVSLVV